MHLTLQWDDGAPTDDPVVLEAATKSNIPVTVYRENDLMAMVFPTLDFKVLASLSNASKTGILNWVTNLLIKRQV
jgi:hypothetical protein